MKHSPLKVVAEKLKAYWIDHDPDAEKRLHVIGRIAKLYFSEACNMMYQATREAEITDREEILCHVTHWYELVNGYGISIKVSIYIIYIELELGSM